MGNRNPKTPALNLFSLDFQKDRKRLAASNACEVGFLSKEPSEIFSFLAVSVFVPKEAREEVTAVAMAMALRVFDTFFITFY
ncbi:MAG: hypothetical protein P8M25_10510 [Paracoccaceae bacterium]|jgi:hypothetical protein|nr:hypothetical protein [Paracoccaceae bacterium]